MLVGKTTALTLRAFLMEGWQEDSARNVSMSFKLPENLQCVSGQLAWQGDIKNCLTCEQKIEIMELN